MSGPVATLSRSTPMVCISLPALTVWNSTPIEPTIERRRAEDAVGRDRGHVGGRRAELLDHRDHRLLGAQRAERFVELLAARGGAAGRVDGDDHRLDRGVVADLLERCEPAGIGRDRAVDLDARDAIADRAVAERRSAATSARTATASATKVSTRHSRRERRRRLVVGSSSAGSEELSLVIRIASAEWLGGSGGTRRKQDAWGVDRVRPIGDISTMAVTIRLATPADFDGMHRARQQLSARLAASRSGAGVGRGRACAYIAIEGTEPVGYAVMTRHFFDRAFVELLMVGAQLSAPRHRNGDDAPSREPSVRRDLLWTSTNESNAPMRALARGRRLHPERRCRRARRGRPGAVLPQAAYASGLTRARVM